ncbi:MAG: hypothetical protein WCL51_03685 [Bacteroidota bacterium]
MFNAIKQPYFNADAGTDAGGDNIFEGIDLSDVADAEPIVETEETKPVETVVDTPYKIPVKFNHQDMELTQDEAVPLIQKGMNYDRAIERARQEAETNAVDLYIAGQGFEWNGKPILTKADYDIALYEQSLQEKGLEATDVTKLVDEHPTVRRAREIAEQNTKTEATTKEYTQFVKEYPDVKVTEIPKEVFEIQRDSGKSLADSMTAFLYKAEIEKNKQLTQNIENSKKAPVGSVTAFGNDEPTIEDDFLKGFNS